MRPLKQRKVAALLHLSDGGVSDRTLATILAKLKAAPSVLEDIPANYSSLRRDTAQAKLDELSVIATTLQLKLESGNTFQWKVALPQDVLPYLAAQVPAFKAMLLDIFKAGQEYKLALFHDECTPGNVLRPDNKRKATFVHMTLVDFGHRIYNELTWWPCAVLRHGIAHDAVGGLSGCLRILFRAMFLDDSRLSTGILIELPRPALFRCKLAVIIADADGIKVMFDFKRSSGIKPCGFCKNAACKGMLPEFRADAYLKDISEPDISSFDLCSDEEIWQMHDRLAAAKAVMRKTEFDKFEKSFG